MSQRFPTYKQFKSQVRGRIRAEYPDADRESVEACVQMQTEVSTWLRHLGRLIEQGARPESQVLNTLTPDQLYTLKTHLAPRCSLDWYIPLIYRSRS